MSKWMNGGAPQNCANPNCKEPFIHHAWRGSDGKYYCNEWCEEFVREREPEEVKQ